MNDLAHQLSTQLAGFTAARTRINAERTEAGPVPTIARPYFNAVDKAAAQVVTIIGDAHTKGTKILANDLVYPEGRARQLRQLLADAERKANAAVETAAANTEVAHAVLLDTATPKAPTGTSATHARTDAQMILNGAKDATDMLNQLARRNDNIGALVVSQWGRDYITSTGIDGRHAEVIFEGVQGNALQAALSSGDTERERAAAHALNLGGLRQLRDGASQTARATLGYMRTAWSVSQEGSNDPNAPAAPSILEDEDDAA